MSPHVGVQPQPSPFASALPLQSPPYGMTMSPGNIKSLLLVYFRIVFTRKFVPLYIFFFLVSNSIVSGAYMGQQLPNNMLNPRYIFCCTVSLKILFEDISY